LDRSNERWSLLLLDLGVEQPGQGCVDQVERGWGAGLQCSEVIHGGSGDLEAGSQVRAASVVLMGRAM
jgi:hypothetical protein